MVTFDLPDEQYLDLDGRAFYAFSPRTPETRRRRALVVAFSASVLVFAALALSKLPFIAHRDLSGEPVEFSANLAAVGLSTGVTVTRPVWAFVVPHIAVAAALEVLLALVMLRKLRIATPWVRRVVFVLAMVHCALIAPNWRGLPGPVGNVLFGSVCAVAAMYLHLVDSKSQLAFSWLVLALNSGPVGEVGFWLTLLHERWVDCQLKRPTSVLTAADDGDPAAVAAAAAAAAAAGGGDPAVVPEVLCTDSPARGVLLLAGMLACVACILVFLAVGVYNVWFFTHKYGALPFSLRRWTKSES